MCGLFGWQWAKGKSPNKGQRHRLALALAEANDKRGGQSWGVCSPEVVMRGLGRAANHAPRFSNLRALFGHSRWATHGENNIRNTHPFYKEGVLLSHNGVVSNHSALNREHGREFVVDSEHILAHLVEGKPLTDLHAYGAITWAKETAKDRIYMGRLNQRGQLSVVRTEFGVVWSSEETALELALGVAGIPIVTEYEVAPGKVFYTEDGVLYEDVDHASIAVGDAPTPIRDWSSYGSRSTTYEDWSTGWTSPHNANSGYWCNKHLKRWNTCPCPSYSRGETHVVTIPTGVVPVEGQTLAVPGEGATLKADYAKWLDGRRKNEGERFFFCTDNQCANRYPCTVHPDPATTRPTAPAGVVRTTLAPAPEPDLSQLAPEEDDREWARYLSDMTSAAAEAEDANLKKEILEELAEEYLLASGVAPRALDGYSREGITMMAEEAGFNAEEAWLQLTQTTPNTESINDPTT